MLKNKEFLIKYLPYIFALGLFLILLAAGLYLYKDFGVPVDEPYQLELAIKNHRYIFDRDPELLSDQDRYHGAIVELPLFWVATRFAGPEKVYIRHLLLYLAFLAGLAIFYFLSLKLFRNQWWALLNLCMLAASPRIFSDAFYNSKDVVFMDMFILAIWTLILLIDGLKKKRRRLVINALVVFHSIASSLLIATRVTGIVIIPLSLTLLVFAELESKNFWKESSKVIILYLALAASLIVLFWPILWHDPLEEFINAFHQMSKYLEYGKGVLYRGELIPSDALPWHYLPVWIGISTPVIILAGFIPGLVSWIRSIDISAGKGKIHRAEDIIRWISQLETLNWLAVVGWLSIPLIAVFWFHPVFYNGWRHMFFIYPALVIFSVRGYYALHKWLSQKTGRFIEVTIVTVLVLIVGLAEPIEFLRYYHQYGIVYFNQLAGDPKTIRQRYETDYWGLSYKEAIDYILDTNSSEKIPVYMADVSGLDYINSALSSEQKARIVNLDSPDNGARYFIGNFEFHPGDYEYSKLSREYYSLVVRGIKILVIYQFH